MSFKFKSRKQIKIVLLLEAGLLPSVVVLLLLFEMFGVLSSVDYQILDWFYAQAIQHDYGPARSSQIVYVTITDDSYAYFGKNILDREEMAPVNEALAQFGAAAVAYDIIFAHPSTSQADQRFADSLQQLRVVYLPLTLDQLPSVQSFQWQEGVAYERLRTQLCQPHERGMARPFYATHALMQLDDFAEVASHTGHISASSDPDGVYRHIPLPWPWPCFSIRSECRARRSRLIGVARSPSQPSWAVRSPTKWSFLSTPTGGYGCPTHRYGAMLSP